ncbi:type II secretion system protein GspL [Aestuariibacter sp. AA17]|uniref:Type II secretion system protein L n=1 Tax=Fluctibacter corallii TaxID=2984329 RepID=A0ABT3AAZ6_9ALTE|nr:type II secretion system protein GspL [Aestuariibacter sp. AA17]MCV2885808.1 type II secretion system protein GspL [Aestuariibacter sp. AA17]
MEELVIRLGSDANPVIHWMVWSDSEKDIIASGELAGPADLASLPERTGKHQAIVLIPGSECLMTWVEMPAKASRKALQAIPYMLEDELSGDINEHFFAIGPKVDHSQGVAVIQHRNMVRYKAMLADAEIHPTRILPDTLALPHHEDEWSMVALGDELIVRQDSWKGMSGHTNWMLDAIGFHAKHQTEAITVHNYGETDLSTLANTHPQQAELELPMQILAKGALKEKFTLLQGEYKIKRAKSQGAWQKWKLAAILAGVALLTSLIDKTVTLQSLTAEKESLNAQITEEFKRAFPETRRIVNVRSQMKQKVASLEQGGSGLSMLIVLTQLSDAFAQSNVKPQTLRFDSKRSELRMQAVASNFEALEQFRRLAEAQGFEVQPGAINNRDNQVIGSLSIRS